MNISVNKKETVIEFEDGLALLILKYDNEDIEEFLVKSYPEYAIAIYNEDEIDWRVDWYSMDSVQQFRVMDDIINNLKPIEVYAEI